MKRVYSRLLIAAALALAAHHPAAPPAMLAAPPAAAQTVTTGPSGLPLPRFVSLRSSRVNVRRGPGQSYDVAWVYVQAGLPVEIVQEFENWRRIRDWEGGEGWVFHSLLSGRRTVLVAPWRGGERASLHRSPDREAPIVAYLEPTVVGEALECTDGWCRVRGERFQGWIEQTRLWGVYPDETLGR